MDNYDVVHAISFDYGQRHKAELMSAVAIATYLGVASHEVVKIPGLLKGTSPLVSDAELETYTDYTSMDKIIGDRTELTFVPLRNPLFLLIAANHALALGCRTVMTGICANDGANYHDCTGEFRHAMEDMLTEALGVRFTVSAPLISLTKAEIVRLAMSYGQKGVEVMALTHTCYAGQRPPCGKCHACVLRAEGFRQAGVADPLLAMPTLPVQMELPL
jgi:7-cyano-7-deazaguanine synthase